MMVLSDVARLGIVYSLLSAMFIRSDGSLIKNRHGSLGLQVGVRDLTKNTKTTAGLGKGSANLVLALAALYQRQMKARRLQLLSARGETFSRKQQHE